MGHHIKLLKRELSLSYGPGSANPTELYYGTVCPHLQPLVLGPAVELCLVFIVPLFPRVQVLRLSPHIC